MMRINMAELEKSNIHQFFLRLNNVFLVVLFVVVNCMISILFNAISQFTSAHPLSHGFQVFSTNDDAVLLAIFVGPIIETLIFQYGIIEWLRQKRPIYQCCIISAFTFALIHLYNVYYFCFAFFSGLVIAYLYTLKKKAISGMIVTLLAHMLYNTLVFFFTRVL